MPISKKCQNSAITNVKLHLPIESVEIEVVCSSVPTFCTMLDSYIVMQCNK